MLAEMFIAIDGNSTEVAHLGTAAARNVVATFGFDQASPTLGAFSNTSSSHFFLYRCPVLDLILFGQLFTREACMLFPESLTLPTGLLVATRIRAAEPLHIRVQQSRVAARGAADKLLTTGCSDFFFSSAFIVFVENGLGEHPLQFTG